MHCEFILALDFPKKDACLVKFRLDNSCHSKNQSNYAEKYMGQASIRSALLRDQINLITLGYISDVRIKIFFIVFITDVDDKFIDKTYYFDLANTYETIINNLLKLKPEIISQIRVLIHHHELMIPIHSGDNFITKTSYEVDICLLCSSLLSQSENWK